MLKFFFDKDSYTVEGSISPSTGGESGLISFSLINPGPSSTGSYSCEATGFTSDGHSVIYTTSLQVSTSPVDLADVVDFVHKLDAENQEYKKKIEDLNSTTTNIVEQLEKKISILSTQNKDLTSSHTELKQQFINLQTKTNELTETLKTKVSTNNLHTAVCAAKSTCMTDSPWQIWLSGGDEHKYGTVIIHNNETGQSGTVCDYDWDIKDANIACRSWDGTELQRPKSMTSTTIR